MKIAALLFFLFICVAPCFADQETQSAQGQPEPEKAQEYLPGEQVVTPTGQKLKVWSTRGAVSVNKAPEPFKDDSLQGDLNVVIDGRSVQRDDAQRPYRESNR